jgi:hypothetical protein
VGAAGRADDAGAADVERYLADEPVAAGPPSKVYRLRKFVRRHRGPVLAAGLVLLALVGGSAATTWQAVRAIDAEHEASTALAEVRRAGQVQLTEQDRAFLRKVQKHYEAFAATKGDSPESRSIQPGRW